MSNHEPLVSVIMPAFNAERWLQSAIDSVLAQTYPHFELIIVDDGSSDGTARLAQLAQSRDTRVRYFHQPNQGVAAARNCALSQSRGDLIAPLDADDTWHPDKLEKQVQAILSCDETVGLIYAWSLQVDAQGQIMEGCPMWTVEGYVFPALLYRNFIGNASAPLIKKRYLTQAGNYNEQLLAEGAQGCEDWDLYLRLAECCEFRVVREYLVNYRVMSGTMSSQYESMARSHRLLMETARRRHPEISAATFRWSAGHFFLYLLIKSYEDGNPKASLHWFQVAMLKDPAILLSPRIYRVLAVTFWRLLLPKKEPSKVSLPGKELSTIICEKSKPRYPWRPFTRCEVRRWMRVARQPLPSFKAI